MAEFELEGEPEEVEHFSRLDLEPYRKIMAGLKIGQVQRVRVKNGEMTYRRVPVMVQSEDGKLVRQKDEAGNTVFQMNADGTEVLAESGWAGVKEAMTGFRDAAKEIGVGTHITVTPLEDGVSRLRVHVTNRRPGPGSASGARNSDGAQTSAPAVQKQAQRATTVRQS